MREKIKSSSDKKNRRRRRTRRPFRLPADVVSALKKEFPDAKNIDRIIDKIFETILSKIIRDGSCTVSRFGYFFAYKSFSNRVRQVVPRIKFAISRTLRLDIQNDQYLMDKISDYAKSKDRVALFMDGDHENGGRELRQMAERRGRSVNKMKNETNVQDEIASILEESFDDEPGM